MSSDYWMGGGGGEKKPLLFIFLILPWNALIPEKFFMSTLAWVQEEHRVVLDRKGQAPEITLNEENLVFNRWCVFPNLIPLLAPPCTVNNMLITLNNVCLSFISFPTEELLEDMTSTLSIFNFLEPSPEPRVFQKLPYSPCSFPTLPFQTEWQKKGGRAYSGIS